MVKEMSEDLIKVVIDYKSARKKDKHQVDTGRFKCIHKSKTKVDKPKESMGLVLCVEGKQMPNNVKKQQEPAKFKTVPKVNFI